MTAYAVVRPTTAVVPTGATAPTKVLSTMSYVDILSTPASTNSYITWQGGASTVNTVRLVLGYANPMTASQVMHTIRVVHIESYKHDFGWWYPARIIGYVGGIGHSLNLGIPVPPVWAGSVVPDFYQYFIILATAETSKAADGTPWSACSRFEVEFAIHAVPIYNVDGTVTSLYGGANSAYLAHAEVQFAYTDLPVVGSITPSGSTVLTPQPTITWWTQASPQSSYQVAVLAQGSVDANGVALGAANFDPTTASPVWNSGKVRSIASSAVVPVPLQDGGYITYVRAWTESPDGETVGRWWLSSLWAVDAENPDPPTVTIADDSATYTTRTTIAPAVHTPGFVTPHFYEVQYLDTAGTWVPINSSGGLLTGNTTTVIYDSLKAPGQSVSYRARGRYTRSDSLVVVTPWVTATATAANRHEWWLRCLSNRSLNRSLSDFTSLVVQDFRPARQRPQAVTWGVGSRFAVITQDVVKSETMELKVMSFTSASHDALTALLEHDGDLILVSPFAEMWRVRVGGEVSEEHVRAAPRSGETTPLGMVRVVSFSLIEVG